MKIMWVVRPAEGGIIQHLQQLLAGIPDFEIVVAAPSSLREMAGERRFFAVDLADGINPKCDLGSIRKLRRLLRQERPEIVHAHGLKAALITSAALMPKRHPRFLFTAHNALPEGRSVLGRWGLSAAQRWIFGGMNTIISVSDAVRSQIVHFVPERKVLTIYNGVSLGNFGELSLETSRESLSLGPEDQVVGTVARLIRGKGVDTLLEAVSLISKIVPSLRLVVVGDGPERSRLEQYALGLGLEKHVKFLGWRDDVPALMAGWNCFALPSLSEGFSLSVLEAMASRLPVVVSDLPALREAVVPGRGGFAVLPGNAAELAAALLHVLKAPEKARVMGQFNRERVNTYFGADRMVRSTRALYEGMLL